MDFVQNIRGSQRRGKIAVFASGSNQGKDHYQQQTQP